jgi:hypothetical protein
MKKLFAIIIALLLFYTTAYAADPYWVDDNGEETTWASCQSASPVSGTAACTLAIANSNADAGDIVYLRAGTYNIAASGYGISPTNSGSAGNVITFSGYASETVTFDGAYLSTGVYLLNDDYIKVTKIDFTDFSYNMRVLGSNHNEISYCDFGTNYAAWEHEIATGTCTGNDDNICTHADDATAENFYVGKDYRLWNVTDGSACVIVASTSTTITCRDTGGDYVGLESVHDSTSDLSWDTNDTYKVTPIYIWENAVVKYSGAGVDSEHNWIHHNTFHGNGGFAPVGPTADEGIVLSIGVANSTVDSSGNNTIEFNEMYAAGHHVFASNSGLYNVIRGNYMHNESWWNDTGYWKNKGCAEEYGGKCGYRVAYNLAADGYGGNGLWEGNKFAYGAQYGGPHADKENGTSGGGNALATSDNIYRYNEHFANASFGLTFGASISGAVKDNRVYNNTYYRNGWNEDTYGNTNEDDDQAGDSDHYRVGVDFRGDDCDDITTNVIKNELFYLNWAERNNYTPGTTFYPPMRVWNATVDACNTVDFTNMYFAYDSDNKYSKASAYGAETNPLFVDPDVTDPTALTLSGDTWVGNPDLSLQSNSTAIDAGTYLTTVHTDDTSSGTTLEVVDSSYFQDGTWGSSLATLNADYICVGLTVADAECVQIDSITDGDTIELASGISRSDNDYVWLQKDSSGNLVLAGTAPDYGAHEYTGTASLSGFGGSGGTF